MFYIIKHDIHIGKPNLKVVNNLTCYFSRIVLVYIVDANIMMKLQQEATVFSRTWENGLQDPSLLLVSKFVFPS